MLCFAFFVVASTSVSIEVTEEGSLVRLDSSAADSMTNTNSHIESRDGEEEQETFGMDKMRRIPNFGPLTINCDEFKSKFELSDSLAPYGLRFIQELSKLPQLDRAEPDHLKCIQHLEQLIDDRRLTSGSLTAALANLPPDSMALRVTRILTAPPAKEYDTQSMLHGVLTLLASRVKPQRFDQPQREYISDAVQNAWNRRARNGTGMFSFFSEKLLSAKSFRPVVERFVAEGHRGALLGYADIWREVREMCQTIIKGEVACPVTLEPVPVGKACIIRFDTTKQLYTMDALRTYLTHLTSSEAVVPTSGLKMRTIELLKRRQSESEEEWLDRIIVPIPCYKSWM